MTLAAVLMAGGESRRMGRDKAMLPANGEPLWHRQLAMLRELSPAALYVSARERPVWLPGDARFIADPVPARGPLGGLAATLAAKNATHLLALAVDMPAMTSGHLDTLWRAAEPGRGVLPWLAGQPEPLAAIYPAEAFPFATAHLAGADVSMRTFTQALLAADRMKMQTIPPGDASLYVNWNTPSDRQSHDAPSAHNDD